MINYKKEQQICLLFIPVKIYASASDDCSSFMDVVDFYDAIQVTDASLGPPTSSQSSTREKMKTQGSAQTHTRRFRVTFRLVLYEICNISNSQLEK